MATTTDLSDLMFMPAAAKACGMDRRRFRALMIANGVAIVWAKGDTQTRLKVRLSDARRVICEQRYLPTKAAKRKPPRAPVSRLSGKPMHPAVRC